MGLNYRNVNKIDDIPFLPIEFFKKHKVCTGDFEPKQIFHSSGTTGSNTSRHYISDTDHYRKSIVEGFKTFFGVPEDYTFIALIPGFESNKNSSLIFMVREWIRLSGKKYSNFYALDDNNLISVLQTLRAENERIFFIGISYALLDFTEKYSVDLGEDSILMETGGMKGRREEVCKQELHDKLAAGFNKANIQSEYGMTELLSQAYSLSSGIFKPVSWMKVLVRDIRDPFETVPVGVSGGLNIIDLANLDSCGFIETQDQGRKLNDKEFEISGRLQISDIRGCNLLME